MNKEYISYLENRIDNTCGVEQIAYLEALSVYLDMYKECFAV